MSQLYSETDIDRSIAEFSKAVGLTLQRERAERLKADVEARRKAHRASAVVQHQLCEALARQIRLEVA